MKMELFQIGVAIFLLFIIGGIFMTNRNKRIYVSLKNNTNKMKTYAEKAIKFMCFLILKLSIIIGVLITSLFYLSSPYHYLKLHFWEFCFYRFIFALLSGLIIFGLGLLINAYILKIKKYNRKLVIIEFSLIAIFAAVLNLGILINILYR